MDLRKKNNISNKNIALNNINRILVLKLLLNIYFFNNMISYC